MPKIILITHQKGGVGKSTLTFNMANALKNDVKVAIIDLDWQGSIYKSRSNSDIPVYSPDQINEIQSLDFDFTEEPPLKILAFLYNSFEALFAVVAYESGLSLKKNESGANFWAVKNAEIFGIKWQIKQVRDMMDFIQFLESGIKMGIVSADAAIPMLSATFIALQNNFKFCTRYKDEIKDRNRKLVKQNLKIAK